MGLDYFLGLTGRDLFPVEVEGYNNYSLLDLVNGKVILDTNGTITQTNRTNVGAGLLVNLFTGPSGTNGIGGQLEAYSTSGPNVLRVEITPVFGAVRTYYFNIPGGANHINQINFFSFDDIEFINAGIIAGGNPTGNWFTGIFGFPCLFRGKNSFQGVLK